MKKTLLQCAIALTGFASVVAGAQGTPDPRAVLARYAQVTNAAKLATTPGQRMTGTFEMPAQGLKGQVEGFRDGEGRSVQVISIPGIGELKEGTEATFKWSMNPIEGPKIIEGAEFAEAKEREDPKASMRDPSVVVNAEFIRRDSVDGKQCIKLKLSWKSGRTTTDCYDESTGYLLSSETTEKTSMGPIASTMVYSEYQTFDGVTVPTKTVQTATGTQLVLRVTGLTFEKVDPAKFVLPPEIQTLRKK